MERYARQHENTDLWKPDGKDTVGCCPALQIHQPCVFHQRLQISRSGDVNDQVGDGTCVIDIAVSESNQFDHAKSYDLKQATNSLISNCIYGSAKAGGTIGGLGVSMNLRLPIYLLVNIA